MFCVTRYRDNEGMQFCVCPTIICISQGAIASLPEPWTWGMSANLLSDLMRGRGVWGHQGEGPASLGETLVFSLPLCLLKYLSPVGPVMEITWAWLCHL